MVLFTILVTKFILNFLINLILNFFINFVLTFTLENLLYICEAFDMKLSEFFSDKRFDDAEANDWKNKID